MEWAEGVLQARKTQIICNRSSWASEAEWGRLGPGNQERFLKYPLVKSQIGERIRDLEIAFMNGFSSEGRRAGFLMNVDLSLLPIPTAHR